jgi:hypothetical protein
MEANHIGIVKFTGPDDEGYRKVKPHIEDLIQKAEAQKAEEGEKAKSTASVSVSGT